MKNKYFKTLFLINLILINLISLANSDEEFQFNITEIEINKNGNLIIGKKGGKAKTIDGYEIIGKNFIYNKKTNTLIVSGNVKMYSTINDTIIFSDKATYLKNDEVIFTEGNSKAEGTNNTLTATKFKYDKKQNIIVAENNVTFLDQEKETKISSDKATYLKNDEVIFTEGNSKAEGTNNTLTATKFKYDKKQNIIVAENNVTFLDQEKETKISSDKATYLKNDEVIFTEGNSKAEGTNNTLTATKFKYDKKQNIIVAENNVTFLDQEKETKISSDKATYLKNDEVIFTEGNSKAEGTNNTLTATKFKYDKKQNIIVAENNVTFLDQEKETKISSDKATYLKNDEVIFTEGNSKAEGTNNTLTATKFKYDKKQNIIVAENNVTFLDQEKETKISSDKATYLKNDEVIFTEGDTFAILENKYDFSSSNLKYEKYENKLSSNNKSKILDNNGNFYEVESFDYKIDHKFLKAKKVNLSSKIEKDKIDNYFFSEGFFNFNKKNFLSKELKIKLHKDIFDNEEQDPRLYGVSSYGTDEVTVVNKGIFTSCKLNNDCPPWAIYSKKITHDKIKKDLIYENAVLKIYDIPVLYFPKFFHPDPTVERRTGFLQPQFNRSKAIGDSLYLPYFKFEDEKSYLFSKIANVSPCVKITSSFLR